MDGGAQARQRRHRWQEAVAAVQRGTAAQGEGVGVGERGNLRCVSAFLEPANTSLGEALDLPQAAGVAAVDAHTHIIRTFVLPCRLYLTRPPSRPLSLSTALLTHTRPLTNTGYRRRAASAGPHSPQHSGHGVHLPQPHYHLCGRIRHARLILGRHRGHLCSQRPRAAAHVLLGDGDAPGGCEECWGAVAHSQGRHQVCAGSGGDRAVCVHGGPRNGECLFVFLLSRPEGRQWVGRKWMRA